jgi:hypothetical protein
MSIEQILNVTVFSRTKYSEVYAVCFTTSAVYNLADDAKKIIDFTRSNYNTPNYTNGIVKLSSVSSPENDYHSGKGNESFKGTLSRVFGNVDDVAESELTDAILIRRVYVVTRDGINHTAWRVGLLKPDLVDAPISSEGNVAFSADLASISATLGVKTDIGTVSDVYAYGMVFTGPQTEPELLKKFDTHVASAALVSKPNTTDLLTSQTFVFVKAVDIISNDIVNVSEINSAYVYIFGSDADIQTSNLGVSLYDYKGFNIQKGSI